MPKNMKRQDKWAEIELSALNIRRGFRRPEDWGASSEGIWNFFTQLHVSVQGEMVLDAGCGVGTIGLVLANKGGIVVGLDISRDSLRVAKDVADQMAIFNFFPILGDLENLPLKDEYFDLCVCSGVLHHFPNLDVVSKLIKILKLKGKIIIIEPNASNPIIKLSHYAKKLMRTYLTKMELDTPNEILHSCRTYIHRLSEHGLIAMTVKVDKNSGNKNSRFNVLKTNARAHKNKV
jgi:ubiquinone/menaquinone biosynthesis C-methylase UbiE